MQTPRSRLTGPLIVAGLLLAACTPSAALGGVRGTGTAPSEPARAPKHLTAATLREPTSLHPDLMLASTTSGIKWQDDVPFTADDLVFSFEV